MKGNIASMGYYSSPIHFGQSRAYRPSTVVRGIKFVLGSIPNGAGTMALRCFLFSSTPTTYIPP